MLPKLRSGYRTLLLAGITALAVALPGVAVQARIPGVPATIAAPVSLSQRPASQTVVEEIATVGMTVSDMDRAVSFYERVLNFRKISDVEVYGREYDLLQGLFGLRMRIVKMRLGQEVIELTEYLTPSGRPIPIDSRSNDLWFQHIAIVVNDMDAAYQRLRRFKVQHVSTGPQRLPESIPAAAGIEAFYFRDPDGHNLELIYFPPRKGDPRWQQSSPRLFLGIDHTAIGISDTDTSLRFYQELLGLKVAGESENFGPEQERLNNVFGARLQITGLKAAAGPGLEFLDYLSPATGRPYPSDSQVNDLWHWETTLVVKDVDAVAQRLRSAGTPFVSSRVVTMPDRALGFRKGFLVRDPDGHVMRIVEDSNP